MPAKKPSRKDTPEAQIKRFQEAAEQLECDTDEERFRERLKRVAAAKLPPEKSGH